MVYGINKDVKIFLIKLLALICLVVTLDFFIGLLLKHLFYKQRSGKYFTTSHALNDSKEDVMIFGNSHAAQHFDAPLMTKELAKSVFNFGNQGQSVFYTYPLVKAILIHHKPQLIILNLDYNELQYDAASYERLSVFLPYYHFNPVVDSAIAMIGSNEKIKAWSSLYRYNSTIGYSLLNTYTHAYSKSMQSLGYDPMSGNICAVKGANNGDTEQAGDIIHRIDTAKTRYLIKLINFIQASHIKLLVTTTPLVSDYKDDSSCEQKMKEILAKLNVDYLDYGASTDFKGKCELFVDGSHLNSTGAVKWTEVCAAYIKHKLL